MKKIVLNDDRLNEWYKKIKEICFEFYTCTGKQIFVEEGVLSDEDIQVMSDYILLDILCYVNKDMYVPETIEEEKLVDEYTAFVKKISEINIETDELTLLKKKCIVDRESYVTKDYEKRYGRRRAERESRRRLSIRIHEIREHFYQEEMVPVNETLPFLVMCALCVNKIDEEYDKLIFDIRRVINGFREKTISEWMYYYELEMKKYQIGLIESIKWVIQCTYRLRQYFNSDYVSRVGMINFLNRFKFIEGNLTKQLLKKLIYIVNDSNKKIKSNLFADFDISWKLYMDEMDRTILGKWQKCANEEMGMTMQLAPSIMMRRLREIFGEKVNNFFEYEMFSIPQNMVNDIEDCRGDCNRLCENEEFVNAYKENAYNQFAASVLILLFEEKITGFGIAEYIGIIDCFDAFNVKELDEIKDDEESGGIVVEIIKTIDEFILVANCISAVWGYIVESMYLDVAYYIYKQGGNAGKVFEDLFYEFMLQFL